MASLAALIPTIDGAPPRRRDVARRKATVRRVLRLLIAALAVTALLQLAYHVAIAPEGLAPAIERTPCHERRRSVLTYLPSLVGKIDLQLVILNLVKGKIRPWPHILAKTIGPTLPLYSHSRGIRNGAKASHSLSCILNELQFGRSRPTADEQDARHD